jgi:serine/threonine protein kinase
MTVSAACPSEKLVVDFAAGRLAGEELAACQRHLDECPKCHEAAEWIKFHFVLQDRRDDESRISGTRPLLGDQSDTPSDERQDTRSGVDSNAIPHDLDSRQFDLSTLSPSTDATAIGRIGSFDILQWIGCGGMGVVFLARDVRLRRLVAIKTLNARLSSIPKARRRFAREARVMAAIKHPNVVTIYSVEDHNDQPFLVMEYLEGRSLRERIKQGPLAVADTLLIALRVAEALDAAHRQGVVHRDVKPANIMLEGPWEQVKIMDFGLARAAVDGGESSTRDLALGTPAYMSPEQLRGDPVDARADLFALGAVIYTCLVGRSPFNGRTSLEIGHRIAHENPPVLREVNPQIPEYVSDLVMRLLEKEPERRYSSAADVAGLLRRHLAMLQQPLSGDVQPAASQTARGWVTTALLGCGVVVAALVLLYVWRR